MGMGHVGYGGSPIEEIADDRWLVGDRDVRVVLVEGEGTWVGTFWTWDGYPDPEATLLLSRSEALHGPHRLSTVRSLQPASKRTSG